MATLKNTTFTSNGFLEIPKGTTAQRPSNPDIGFVFYNTDFDLLEFFDGVFWLNFARKVRALSTGSVVNYQFNDFDIHKFEGNGTFSPVYPGYVDVLLVAGGGGGGSQNAGGGGAGGVVFESVSVEPQDYSITVGSGATGGPRNPGGGRDTHNDYPAGIRGGDTQAFGLIAIGGGNGAGDDYNGVDGGSGGGGADDASRAGPGLSVQNSAGSQGYGSRGGDGRIGGNGQAGAGGGGAGGPGQTNLINDRFAFPPDTERDGGTGIYFGHIFGENVGEKGWFAGGGGGAMKTASSTGKPGKGGIGGGGRGAFPNGAGLDGQPNTGGGGGGASVDDGDSAPYPSSGNGGSGIVLIRYRI